MCVLSVCAISTVGRTRKCHGWFFLFLFVSPAACLGAVQFVVVRGMRVLRERYFLDATGEQYEPAYKEDMDELCGPHVGQVLPLANGCVSAVQCFRFTLHVPPDVYVLSSVCRAAQRLVSCPRRGCQPIGMQYVHAPVRRVPNLLCCDWHEC